jgi:hypothetical protein
MAVTYSCDTCGKSPLAEEEVLRKKIVFVNKASTHMAVAYMPEKSDYCLECAQKEAAPFRRKRGRPEKKK